jgi:hypothetical protein
MVGADGDRLDFVELVWVAEDGDDEQVPRASWSPKVARATCQALTRLRGWTMQCRRWSSRRRSTAVDGSQGIGEVAMTCRACPVTSPKATVLPWESSGHAPQSRDLPACPRVPIASGDGCTVLRVFGMVGCRLR